MAALLIASPQLVTSSNVKFRLLATYFFVSSNKEVGKKVPPRHTCPQLNSS